MNSSYTRNYPSIYRGIVEDNIDPENLGRCKIRVPAVHGDLTYSAKILPWARPIVLSPVHENRGSVNLPDIGDIVWVFFEGSDKEFPIYFGGTYATGDIEVDNDRVDFYIEDNTHISYSRESRSYNIEIGTSQFTVSPEGIHIKGNISVEGNIVATGDITGAGTSLSSHTHGGVEPGSGSTSAPN